MTIPKRGLNHSQVSGPGEIPEHNPIINLRSFAAEEDDIKFGRAVMGGTSNEEQVKIFASASGKFKGVAAYSTEASDLDNSQFKQYDKVPVFDQGVINVFVEEAVSPTDTVRIRHTASGSLVAGSFAKTADAGKTVVLSGAEYRSTTTTSGVAQLYIDPVFSVTADT